MNRAGLQAFGQWVRRHPILTLITVALVGLFAWLLLAPRTPDYEYVAEPVTQGAVERVVQASGRIRALNTISVGSEVSGQISEVYVDFNTPVQRGQLLARIDETRPRARALQTQAAVRSAQAALAQAEATQLRARTDLSFQEREYERRRRLSERGFLSESGLDQALAALSAARATAQSATASIASARAGIAQAEAELSSARLDLQRTRIVAPASGVVINKLVEPGTTVAASFQTPNLFEIAADATRMQVEASVDEADIGQVAVGQAVNFTVDAHPNETFRAVVRQIRQAATENQNVISYLAIIEVPNTEGKLLPGMTANVEIVTGVQRNVTRVPVGSLRFRPRREDRPENKEERDRTRREYVWVASDDPFKPARRQVVVGLRGEEYAQIQRGLNVGERVLVRQRSLKEDEEKDKEEEESGR